MGKPVKRAIVPQRIKVTGVRYKQPQPDQGYLQAQAVAQLFIRPALTAYNALCDEKLLTAVETRKVLFIEHTAERRAPLRTLKDMLGGGDHTLAMFIFGLVTEYPRMQGEYIDLAEYGLPNFRIYRGALQRIVSTYRNGVAK